MPEVESLATAMPAWRRALSAAVLVLGLTAGAMLATSGPAVAASSTVPASAVPASAVPTGTASGAAPAQGNGEVTFGVQPASPSNGRIVADARPYFYYGMNPGSSLSDHVAILNYSTKALVLTVYATDALNAVDGGFALQPVEAKRVDAGAWVSLGGARLQVRVPARSVDKAGHQVVGSVLLPVRLCVPVAADPGDHVGGIVASLDTLSQSKDGNRVRLQQRVAARMFIRVSGPLRPLLTVQQLRVSYRGSVGSPTGGTATVSYIVHNGGNVKLGGRQRVTVSGLLGRTGRTPPVADIPLLLPGNSAQVRVQVSQLSAQAWMQVRVTVAGLQLPGDSNPAVPEATAGRHFWAWPWLAVAILALLLLVAAGFLYRRHRAGGPRGPGGHHRGRSPRGGPSGPDTDSTRPDRATPNRTTVPSRSVATLLAALTVALGLWSATPASAAGVPYHDPAAAGRIGLCDRAGHPVTGGSINDRPFVWRVVSSVAAPPDYQGTGRKASLLSYQPRPGVSPDQWSGDQLTATSDYSNPAAPMSQATGQDFTLKEFLGEFTPMVDGLLQLRMYYGIPGRGTWNSSYPSTDIRVTGTRWQVVDPVSLPCTNGTSTSSEVAAGDPAAQPAGAAATTRPPVGTSVATKATGVPTTSTGTSAATAGSAVITASTAAVAGRPDAHGGGIGVRLVLLAGALLVAGGTAFWWRARRSS
ncbi:MAG: hypothetical protein ACR2N4_14840 [Jatrophihabitans sp.]